MRLELGGDPRDACSLVDEGELGGRQAFLSVSEFGVESVRLLAESFGGGDGFPLGSFRGARAFGDDVKVLLRLFLGVDERANLRRCGRSYPRHLRVEVFHRLAELSGLVFLLLIFRNIAGSFGDRTRDGKVRRGELALQHGAPRRGVRGGPALELELRPSLAKLTVKVADKPFSLF